MHVINFLVPWSNGFSSSLAQFKKGPEYLTINATQVFIFLIKSLVLGHMFKIFLILLSDSFLISFISSFLYPISVFEYIYSAFSNIFFFYLLLFLFISLTMLVFFQLSLFPSIKLVWNKEVVLNFQSKKNVIKSNTDEEKKNKIKIFVIMDIIPKM